MTKRDILIYVAGPITKGPLATNVSRACQAGMRLLLAGFSVLVPHLTVYMGQVATGDGSGVIPEIVPHGTTHADWYGLSVVEVRRCDAVYRLTGESTGADLEVAAAQAAGIPVFREADYDALVNHCERLANEAPHAPAHS